MSRPRPPHIVRYTIRVNRPQGERVAALKAKLNAKSDNEVFDYLITAGTNQRDDLEISRIIWRGVLRTWRRSTSFIWP
jgi:hypothetical protein